MRTATVRIATTRSISLIQAADDGTTHTGGAKMGWQEGLGGRRHGLSPIGKARALELQISGIRQTLENGGEVEIGGRVAQRIFDVLQLVAAGFEASAAEC